MAATLPADSSPTAAKNMIKTSGSGQPRSARKPWADTLFALLARASALLTLALLIGIIVSLIDGAMPAIREYGLSFLWRSEWDPVQDQYGGLVMIYGTLMTSVIALLIAVPVSFGIALFLTELSPAWLKRPLGIAVELLAAVPSIVYGMWGLMVFGPLLSEHVQMPLQSLFQGVPVLGELFSGPPVGIGLLSAGIILAIMIIPFIASVMRDVFEVTPPMLKRDDGGHLRDRQHEPAQLAVAVRGGQQHHLGAGQRVRRGQRGPASGLADLSGPGAVLHHLPGAVVLEGAAGAAEEERGPLT